MKFIFTLLAILAPGLVVAQVDPVVANSSRAQLRAITEQMTRETELTLAVSGTNSAHGVVSKPGTVSRVTCVNQATLAGTTATISPSLNGVYMGTVSITIPSATAIGGVVSTSIITSNTVLEGDALRLQISSGLTGAGTLNCLFSISPTMNYRN